MSVKAILILDELEIDLLWFRFAFNQVSNNKGRTDQEPRFSGLDLTFQTRSDLDLASWSFDPTEMKQLELHISPVVLGGKTRKIFFYDCYLANWKNNFTSSGEQPLIETLKITCAGVKDSESEEEFSEHWRETYDTYIEPTTIDKSPKLINYYITDLEGNELDKYESSDRIVLNIETKNAVGEKLTVNIPDKTYDFRHNGIILENDTLENHMITNDLEKVELEVVEEQA